MNSRAMRAIVVKDLKLVRQSKAVMIPLIVLPLVFLVAMPAAVPLMANSIDVPGSSSTQMLTYLRQMPATLQAELAGYTDPQKIVILIILYLFAPMFLIVPLMVASVIAADSFAGEKERKTIEGLLYTPTTDYELFIAKCLSAWVPAVCVSIGGFVVYAVVANIAAWPIMERLFFPNVAWVLLAAWVSPAAAGLGLGAMVLVSSRVQTFQESYQLGGMVVLPIVLLVIGEAAGVIYFSVGLVVALGLILWVVDAGLLWMGGRLFRRGGIIAHI